MIFSGLAALALLPLLLASIFSLLLALPKKAKTAGQDTGKNASHPQVGEIEKALDGGNKITALLSLADHAHAETLRYREHVWKVVGWTVALLWATQTVAQQQAMLDKIPCLKCLCTIFAVCVATFGLRDVYFDYYWFTGNRNLQRRCERLLKFFKKNAYQQKALLPERYQLEDYSLWDCIGHLAQWSFVIYAAYLYVILSILL